MNDAEAETVVTAFANRLRGIGETEIAEQDDFVFRSDDGTSRRYDARKRLMLMVEAFERKLALEDRTTFEDAFSTIARVADGFAQAKVEIVRVSRADGDRVSPLESVLTPRLTLNELPDLSDIRTRLRELAGRIATDEGLPSGEA